MKTSIGKKMIVASLTVALSGALLTPGHNVHAAAANTFSITEVSTIDASINSFFNFYFNSNDTTTNTVPTTDTATNTVPTTNTTTNTVSNADVTSTSVNQSKGTQVIETGKKFLGTPYRWGSPSGVTSTFDCSSFTQYVFKKNGYSIARGARAQSKNGTPVARKDLKVGDLVFFSTPATMKYPADSVERIGHVGIYAGNNTVLHTFGKGGVRFSSISSGWWDKHYVTAVRVIN